jgi:hypothetical protein
MFWMSWKKFRSPVKYTWLMLLGRQKCIQLSLVSWGWFCYWKFEKVLVSLQLRFTNLFVLFGKWNIATAAEGLIVMLISIKKWEAAVAQSVWWLDCELYDWGSISGRGRFSLRHRVQTDHGAYVAFYPMGNGGSFPGGNATGAWS